MDTGGFDLGALSGMGAQVRRQIDAALGEADGILLVCDAQAGLLPADQLFADRLRRLGKPLWLVANKADRGGHPDADFLTVGGVRDCAAVSALHGRGIEVLLIAITRAFSLAPSDGAAPARTPAIAIVGRPNVGKSSLFNAILREERVIVSDEPNTTRDAVDTVVQVGGERVLLVDTAGLRHRRKVHEPVQFFAMARAVETIRRCEVALVVLDATQGFTQDDARLVSRVAAEGRGMVLLVNKWDLVRGGRAEEVPARAGEVIPFARFAPALAVSALTGFQVPRILPLALAVARNLRTAPDPAALEGVLQRAWRAQPPPRVRGRAVRLRSIAWRSGYPAQVELGVQPPQPLPRPYAQYLLRHVQALPETVGVPVEVRVRSRARRP